MIKAADDQPDEEIHRVRPGRVPGSRASVPVELGTPPPWHVDMFTTLGTQLIPMLLGF